MEHLFNPMKPHFRAWLWMHDGFPWNFFSSKFDTCPSPPPPDLTSLYCAASYGFSSLAKRLIIAHAEDVNAKCCGSTTPLHVASLRGYVDVARVLLDHGADINARRDVDITPLHSASVNGHRKVVQFLLDHGATVDARDDFNSTPLFYASSDGHPEVARLLLDHGADPNIRNIVGTPFEIATRKGHHDVARLLQDHGAQIYFKQYRTNDTGRKRSAYAIDEPALPAQWPGR